MPYPNFLIMNNKELYDLACQCLRLDVHPDFNLNIIELLGEEGNRQNFVRFCSDQLILPTVYVKFRSHKILPHLPKEFSDFLAEVHQLNLTRNEKITKQLQEIIRFLNEQEIYPTLLKGAGNLLDNLYSDYGERMMGDIDFLVPEKDFILTAQLMENAGYRKFAEISDYENVMTMKHYPRLYHPSFPGVVEIHRIPINKEYLDWFNQDIINYERREVPSLNGCYVQSDRHKIIHNFIHCQLSNEGFLFGNLPLRDMYDLYLFSKRSSLNEALFHIKENQKAIAYFAFARKAFGLNEHFFDSQNFAYWILNKKHDLKLSSPFFYELFRSTIFISQRVLFGYIGQFFQLFYSKEIRKSVFKRLGTRRWYNDHFNLYKGFFMKNS